MKIKHIIAVALTSCAFLLGAASGAAAHPGTGIVIDRRGNVFYTDLVHIWRIDPAGRKTIAVRHVHSHELSIDANGSVFGEDSEYMGGDRYRHRIWRLDPDGSVHDVVPWTNGFWRDYGFTHDQDGAMYWVRCPERVCTIRKRARNGEVTTVKQNRAFDEPINWLAAGPAGSLYVLDKDALKLLQPSGDTRTVVKRLGGSAMGMLPDGRGGVYVAVYARRAVLHITPGSGTTVVARSPAPWGPSGMARAANGDFWVLEYSTSNEARARRVSAAK